MLWLLSHWRYIAIFRKWEKIEAKVSNFKNHRRFSLRCFSKGVTPVSLQLKNLTRTQRGEGIIQKAEKRLLKERIRNISYILELYQHDKHMYKEELEDLLKHDQELWNACQEEIEKRRELTHKRVMERQISKFNRLLQNGQKKQEQGGHSNHQDDHIDQGPHIDGVKKWVINLSSIPLTKEQESLLAHGPNFAITPKKPPLGEYISNIERMCQSLDTNTAEELRSEFYRVLRQPHQLKPNLKKEEMVAMKQLKTDRNCMVLTADKDVMLVVMDRSDYIKKAKELLEDTNTYRTIQSDPTIRLNNKLVNILRKIKAETGMQETPTG